MGFLPLICEDRQNRKSLGLDGSETIDLRSGAAASSRGLDVAGTIRRADGRAEEITLRWRITLDEVDDCRQGGISHFGLRSYSSRPSPPTTPAQLTPGLRG